MPANRKLVFASAFLLVLSVLAVLTAGLINKAGTPAASSSLQKPPVPPAAFELLDENNRQVTQASYADTLKLIYFGFTYCPDVCPNQLSVMAEALDLLDAETLASVTPLLITLDPERDTAQTIKTYTDFFHPKLVGLTGTPGQIQQAAARFKVYFAKVEDDLSAADYTIDHSSIVFLMGRDNAYLKAFTFRDTPQGIAEAIRRAAQQD
ncbi:MAG: SCO family protein [Parvibaculales bacterium]